MMAHQTILVKNQHELEEAYEALAQEKGGTILLQKGPAYQLRATDYLNKNEDAPVTIRSEDPSDPAEFTFLTVSGRENLTLENVAFHAEQSDLRDYQPMVFVGDSKNITIRDSHFSSNATGPLGTEEEFVEAADLIVVRTSDGVSFVNNVATGFRHGIELRDTYNTTIEDNDLAGFQGDGIRLAGASGVVIADNHIHSPLGSTQANNHSDMIQFWGYNIAVNNENIDIKGNFIDSRGAPTYQMIFGGNEHYDRNGYLFEDVVIEDNVLFGSHRHMIALTSTKDAVVRNNTVFQEDFGYELEKSGSEKSFKMLGTISIYGEGATVEGNIAPNVINPGSNVTLNAEGNLKAYNDHIVNIYSGTSGTLNDLMLRSDSPLNGTAGSSLLWTDGTSDDLSAVASVTQDPFNKSVFVLDASPSLSPDGFAIPQGATAVWTFADGTKKMGANIHHDFETTGAHEYTLTVAMEDGTQHSITRVVEVPPSIFVDMEIEDGKTLLDGSSEKSNIKVFGATVASDGWVEIGGRDRFEIDRTTHALFEQVGFDYGMTIEIAPEAAGSLLYLHNTLHARIDSDGFIHLSLETDEGSFHVSTEDPVFAEGGTARLNFVYNQDAQELVIYFNGEAVGTTEATGTTAPSKFWGLTVGHTWTDAVEARIADFQLSQEGVDAKEVASNYLDWLHQDEKQDEARELTFQYLGEGEMVEATLATSDDIAWSRDAGFRIAESKVILPGQYNPVFDSTEFEISFDMSTTTQNTSGTILYLHQILSLDFLENGRLAFSLITDEGKERIVTPEGDLRMTDAHKITVGYNASESAMYIAIDDKIVAVTEHSGQSSSQAFWALTFGHPWDGKTADVNVDNFTVSANSCLCEDNDMSTLIQPSEDALVFLDFNMDNILDSGSGAVPTKFVGGEVEFLDRGGEDGQAVVLDRGEKITFSRDVDDMFSMNEFKFNVDLQGHENSGDIVFGIHKAFALTYDESEIKFTLQTTDGTFEVTTQDRPIKHGDWYDVEVGYSAELELLQLSLNGEVVDQVSASGTSLPRVHWGLELGSSWGNGFDGVIDNFAMYDSVEEDFFIA